MNIKAFIVALAATVVATAGFAQELPDEELIELPPESVTTNPLDDIFGAGAGTAIGIGVGVAVIAIAVSDDSDGGSSTTTTE